MALLTGRESIDEIGAAQDLFGLPLKRPNRYTTNTTASISDLGKVVQMNSGSAISYTILAASNMVQPFPLDATLVVMQKGAGATSIVAGTGVTINGVSAGTVSLAAIGETVGLWQDDVNSWIAFNKTAA